MRSKLNDVVVIRIVATVLVVGFHVYGMMFVGNWFPDLVDIYKEEIGSNFFGTMNRYNMPLFTFISGYLFSYLLQQSRYFNTWDFIKKKFKRLIIPYLVFVTGTMVVFDTFSISKLCSVVFQAGYYQYWFIVMLFWVFIFAYLVHLYIKSSVAKAFVLIMSFLLAFFSKEIPSFFGISSLVAWFCWFYLGYFINPYRGRFVEVISKYHLYLLMLALFVGGNYLLSNNIVVMNDYFLGLINKFVIANGVILFWYLINMLLKIGDEQWCETPFFARMNRASYGIYCVHFQVATLVISQTSCKIFHLDYFAENFTMLFPFGFFLVTLFVSYVATEIMLKTRVGRFLIG